MLVLLRADWLPRKAARHNLARATFTLYYDYEYDMILIIMIFFFLIFILILILSFVFVFTINVNSFPWKVAQFAVILFVCIQFKSL